MKTASSASPFFIAHRFKQRSFKKDKNMDHLEKRILEILKTHQGKQNAITARDLSSLTLASSRMIRKAIASLVNTYHVPIASSVHLPYGFYFIGSEDEARECLAQYYSRVREVSKRAQSLKEAVKDKFGEDIQKEFDYV